MMSNTLWLRGIALSAALEPRGASLVLAQKTSQYGLKSRYGLCSVCCVSMQFAAVRFRNDDNFHLSQIKRRDHRSILTQVELEDLAATMRESALAGLPFSKSDRNSMVIYELLQC